jgi:hypothetical protein
MARLIKFLQVAPAERRLLARTALLLWVVRCGLWCLPYEKLRRVIFARQRATRGLAGCSWEVDNIIRSVKLMSRYVPAATCLTKALVTLKLLEEAGQPGHLRIGVARSELGKLEAHAWVEREGRVILGGNHAELSRYTVLHAR